VALNRRKCRKQGGIESALERRKYETELERQNNQLGEFASVISHDLRNPLTVTDGYLELVSETVDDEYFTKVGNAHDRMDAIIEDVLTLTRGGSSSCSRTSTETRSNTPEKILPFASGGTRVGSTSKTMGRKFPKVSARRCSTRDRRRARGAGMGLSIVETIATAHGWGIGIEEGVEGGTVEATLSVVLELFCRIRGVPSCRTG